MKRIIPLLIALAALLGGHDATGATKRDKVDPGDIQRKRSENIERKFRKVFDKQNADFAVKLKDLAGWCAEKGLADEAKELWNKAKELDPDMVGEQPKASDAKPSDAEKTDFATRKKALYDAQARNLFDLGSTCFKAGLVGRSYDMVWEILNYSPDHATAHKILSETKYEGKWMDTWEARQLSKGRVFTDEYGWVFKSDLEKFDKELMPFPPRGWLPRDQVEELRSKWSSAWEFDTEHYHIKANTSLADAVAFSKTVEENYKLFFRIYIGYFSSKNQGEMLFGNRRDNKPMKVNYYSSKEDFLRFSSAPQYAAGLYMPMTRTAHFYKIDKASDVRVLKHEATHQLFVETRAARQSQRGAWVVEAAATYMETCDRVQGKIVAQGKKALWVQQFKQVLQTDKAVALGELDQLTYDGFQAKGPMIAYPEAASLACYLMEADDGNYRERFVDYIEAFYTGKLGTGGQLEKYIGVPYAELDAQFRTWIMADDAQAGSAQKPPSEKKEEGKKDTEKKPDAKSPDAGKK